MILITGKVAVLAADRAAFQKLAERQVRLSRTEEGCISYICGEDTMKANTFTFIEHWKDQAAVDLHFAQDYCHQFITAAAQLAQNEVTIELFHADRVEQRKIPKPA